MQNQEINSVTPRFSMKMLTLNQECLCEQEKPFEFNAPRYFDLFSLPDSPVSKYTTSIIIYVSFLVT